jgi:hypothetical protein
LCHCLGGNQALGRLFWWLCGMSKEKYERALNDNRIIFGKAGKTKPQYKRFENEGLQLKNVQVKHI